MAEDAYTQLLEKLSEIAEAVKVFDNPALQERAFEMLAKSLGAQVDAGSSEGDGAGGDSGPGGGRGAGPGRGKRSNRRPAKEGDGNVSEKPSRARRSAPTAEKGLDFRPQGSPSFAEFVAAKSPGSLEERNVVAVFFLKEHMNIERVGVSHVLAAFRDAGWKPASGPTVALRKTASLKGWLDTSDTTDIGLTPSGTHSVEQDLPKAKATS